MLQVAEGEIDLARSASSSRIWLLVFIVVAAVLTPGIALAWNENLPSYPPMDLEGYCYPECHDNGAGVFNGFGPHGNYTTTSGKCDNCHTVHAAAAGSKKLLPKPTIRATCFTCHDGSGGRGVYGVIAARGLTPGGNGHRIDKTDQIPGGNSLSGETSTAVFKGEDSYLTCTDCHSAHGADCVQPFQGERMRNEQLRWPYISSKLLKQIPTSGGAKVTMYGSDWCLACHKGRNSFGPTHNHPVETSATAAPGAPYTYGRVPVLASDLPTSTTVLSSLVGTAGVRYNRGFLMPYPRTPCRPDTRQSVSSVTRTREMPVNSWAMGASETPPRR
ncbi:MAG: cytochrome c3 family protein [Actinomycetota bacterium]|nr:cytochrome c3 family protein [Actinomycetota bacterium]